MDIKNEILMLGHKVKLNKLIEKNAPYEQILKESQILDEFINIYMKDITLKKSDKSRKLDK